MFPDTYGLSPPAAAAAGTAGFFRQQIRGQPRVDPDYWTLTVSAGYLQRPLVLDYGQLRALPAAQLRCTIACAGNPPGGASIGDALWRGVPVRALLERMAVPPAARFARFYSADGYSTALPVTALREAFLVYDMDGAPLPRAHGFPVRLLAPGRYGYKMPKWVGRIELTAEPVTGFWEARGWPADGIVRPTAAITRPRHHEPLRGVVSIAGTAYAGGREITRVEVSIDGGAWMPVPFQPGTRFSRVPWHITWPPPAPGDYRLTVRAVEGDGMTHSDPHSIVARVVDV